MMRTYYIYKLTFPNSKVYIGQTVDFKSRMRGHKNDSHNPNRLAKNCQVNNAIRKYGWENVKSEVIDICKMDMVDYLERKYITCFKSTNRFFGYNRDSGGNDNKVLSKETKRLISKSRQGKPQWSKPILQIDPVTDKVIREWESMHQVERELGIKQSTISMVCNKAIHKCVIKGKEYSTIYKTTGGFKWKFKKLTIV